ncbi:hypothetical protein LDDCCGHA_0811 [Methylobacterium oxalidis]|nr:hypothetical protein LDDCCGHA_0811 [Methylobacterium oxalidis]
MSVQRVARSTILAAALALAAGGAVAQTRGAPGAFPAAASLGYAASPLNGQGYADARVAAPGRTSIEPGMTASISANPARHRAGRAR